MNTKTKSAALQASTRLSGVYSNQNGSEIEVHQDDLGKIVGIFKLGDCCAAQDHREFTLTGLQTGSVVSFCVAFPERECATAWVGQFDNEGHLVLTWQMSIDSHGDAGKTWRATWTGTDTFRPGHRLTPALFEPAKTVQGRKTAVSQPCYCSLV